MISNRAIKRILARGVPNMVYRISNTRKMINHSRVLPGRVYCVRVKYSARMARRGYFRGYL